jgi:large subunit ribosomal protein L31e
MERTYVIPLRKAYLKAPKYVRTNRAVKEVRMFLQRHMKTTDVKLGEQLNIALWARGDSKPPTRVTVVAKKEDDVVYAEIAGKEFVKKDFSESDEKKPAAKAPAAPKKEEAPNAEEKAAAPVKDAPTEAETKEATPAAAAVKETKAAAKDAPAKK